MPIRFRCTHCKGLMAIASRQAGMTVDCPMCGEKTRVPIEDQDVVSLSVPRHEEEQISPPAETSIPMREQSNFLLEIDDRRAPENPMSEPTDRIASFREEFVGESFVPAEPDEEDSTTPLSFRRRRNLDEEMDLTPMVDVTFQLLIFFMVSASFSLQKSIEVPSSDPDQKGATQQVQTLDDLQGTSILVRIDASNSIWIDDERLEDAHRLTDTLRDKMRREQKTELLVMADNQSLHRTIIAIIDAANEVGIQKIRMATKKKNES